TVPFMLDTGAQETGAMWPDLYKALKAVGAAVPTGITSRSLGAEGHILLEKVRCSSIAFDRFQHRDLVFSVQHTNLLGIGFFCRYRTTFDFPRNTIYFEPASRFDLSDRQDFLGLALEQEVSGQLKVRQVVPSSKAFRAGFLVNDEIVSIDGKSIGEWSA